MRACNCLFREPERLLKHKPVDILVLRRGDACIPGKFGHDVIYPHKNTDDVRSVVYGVLFPSCIEIHDTIAVKLVQTVHTGKQGMRAADGKSATDSVIAALRGAICCIAAMLFHPGWHAIFNVRLAQLFRRFRLYPLGWLVYRWNMLIFSIDIHPAVSLGSGLWMPHPIGIVIARDAIIGSACTVYQNVTIGGRGAPPVIGDKVKVGAGACVIGPVIVGDHAQVGANAVVVKSVPDNAKAGGVPARILE